MDEEVFGDDFDDFEEGDEEEDFDDFEDGFEVPTRSEEVIPSQDAVLPFVSHTEVYTNLSF